MACPIGVVFGYSLTAIMIAHLNWRWAFYIQAVMIMPCILVFILTPSIYFNIEDAIKS
jgi:predicted MFS family arabinose efflux permease